MWTGNFWMGGMWILPVIMIIAMLIFIFLIIMIISRVSYGPFWYHHDRDSYPAEPEETPLEILKKRYAIKKDMS